MTAIADVNGDRTSATRSNASRPTCWLVIAAVAGARANC
jgi:hypothetical protein